MCLADDMISDSSFQVKSIGLPLDSSILLMTLVTSTFASPIPLYLDIIISMNHLTLLSFILSCVFASIVHLPLDQRFTTRVAFLNLATLTPFPVVSLPERLLPSLKKGPDPSQVCDWFIDAARKEEVAVVSLQMYLYGGLIASRISNDSESLIKERISRLQNLKLVNPYLKIYASAVVMRIPAYDNDFEQPSYWANYGKLLFSYSFYTDKYSKTGDLQDLEQSQFFKNQIPTSILTQFVNRRQRNQNILIDVVKRLASDVAKGNPLFQKLYITLDDNAQYGFNIAQADQLKQLTKDLNLTDRIIIYPGADEVPLALLSKVVTDRYKTVPKVKLVYRNESSTDLIPNYEGEPLSVSINNQILAAGAQLSDQAEVYFIVNNFDGPKQKQAPNQFNDTPTDYGKFDKQICQNKVIGFIDNKYSNGADISFVSYMLSTAEKCKRNISQWTYAGWNTNGNTVGTAIANAVILSVMKNTGLIKYKQLSEKYCEYCSPCKIGDFVCGNAYFNLLRILEDRDWQAILRQNMISYIREVPCDNFNHLDQDLDFYKRFALKSLKSKAEQLSSIFKLNIQISEVYFPWNRTFEIGISGVVKEALSK